ncbi:hypothetical protein ABT391_37250 [Streptomyces jumonjinensis]|uniref:hypothetical protein n=1 Tax=Streptomyces jumonjinensis TaxID=1945 RepID=UPI003317470C
MPSFLDRAAESDKEIRESQEKDPADPGGAEEPNWDDPDSWGGDGGSRDDSASGNAGNPESGDDAPKQHGDDSPPSGSSAPPKSPPQVARRRGRPRGPDRKTLSVRILLKNDRRLTLAVEQTGHNPQTLVDMALDSLFKRMKISDPGPDQDTHEDVA